MGTYNTRNTNNIPRFKVIHNFFQNFFFPSAVIEWNKLDLNICDSENLNIFKKSLLKFIPPSGSSAFHFHYTRGVKFEFKHGGHKFEHGGRGTNSNMVFKIHLTQFAVALMISKLQLVCFFTVLIIPMTGQFS